MRAAVIYESMYGNSRAVAEAIAEGLQSRYETVVRLAANVDAALLDDLDLLVVGGPTHTLTMSRPETRDAALEQAPKMGIEHIEPTATAPGVREWFARTEHVPPRVAAFCTRTDVPRVFSGSAARSIARELRRRGGHLVEAPTSFVVSKGAPTLLAGELERARVWGAHLAVSAVAGHGVSA